MISTEEVFENSVLILDKIINEKKWWSIKNHSIETIFGSGEGIHSAICREYFEYKFHYDGEFRMDVVLLTSHQKLNPLIREYGYLNENGRFKILPFRYDITISQSESDILKEKIGFIIEQSIAYNENVFNNTISNLKYDSENRKHRPLLPNDFMLKHIHKG